MIERYGRGGPDGLPGSVAHPATMGATEHFLIARRLVEAGVRCVTLTLGMWDWHSANFLGARNHLPKLDQAVAALVEDLHERGLDQDVTVVVWGEFGRSPQINKHGGREHWPQVSNALLAGGGSTRDKPSARRRAWAERSRTARFIFNRSLPPCIATWASTLAGRRSRI